LNLILAGITELLAEVIVLGERSRIIAETLMASVVGSTFLDYKGKAAIACDYQITAFDSQRSRLVAQTGRSVQVPIPVGAKVSELVDQAIEAGMGELDFLCLLQRLQASLPTGNFADATADYGLKNLSQVLLETQVVLDSINDRG
jgi:3-hydroxyisobutyrate dehydrogenase-like beta-hydroxyacid dehydrogenase